MIEIFRVLKKPMYQEVTKKSTLSQKGKKRKLVHYIGDSE